MKKFPTVAIILCAFAAGGITSVDAANQGGVKGRPVVRRGHGVVRRANIQDAVLDLGVQREKYRVWEHAVLHGHRFFTERDRDLRFEYHRTFEHIEKALVNGRLDEPTGREFKRELRDVGEKALELLGDAEKLSPENHVAVKADLDVLQGKLRKNHSETEEVPEALATPFVNKHQNQFENLLSWAEDDKVFSSAKVSSFMRKLVSLEDREDRYKADSKLTDQERETLHEETRELGRELLKAIREA